MVRVNDDGTLLASSSNDQVITTIRNFNSSTIFDIVNSSGSLAFVSCFSDGARVGGGDRRV